MSEFGKNALTWFSIPATNYEKSVKFYEDLLEIELVRQTQGEEEGGEDYAMFPIPEPSGVTGAVISDDKYKPASGGVVIYLLCKDLDGALARVEALGGTLVSSKEVLPGMGHIAIVGDLDGNPIGLHQP